ncbi:hypothetical protein TWF481_001638 [Arthrobotrys musiformis]|uniref:RNase III domain-containing protein n=1 Tax=Arthrobotrys musiformis TaxID=47236 RepID=A0AAV9VTT0_9PEZI
MARLINRKKIQMAIGYAFKSDTHVVEALESTGHARYHGKHDGHKRLALLGDAVLGLVQLDQWYQTSQSRGMADLRLKQHTNQKLQECADRLGITGEILLAPTHADLHLQGGQVQIARETKASAVEALLGAVWLDSNRDFGQVKKVACKLGVVDDES